jgi:hypothetical protein
VGAPAVLANEAPLTKKGHPMVAPKSTRTTKSTTAQRNLNDAMAAALYPVWRANSLCQMLRVYASNEIGDGSESMVVQNAATVLHDLCKEIEGRVFALEKAATASAEARP